MFDEMRGSDEEESRVRPALEWIVDALNRHQVRYQMVGGLAAKAYGARRALVDIDIYVPFDEADSLLEEVRPYVIWGPVHYIGDEEVPWNLTFLKIEYGGQRIELADTSTEPMFYDRKRRCWEEQRIDYEDPVTVEIYGVVVDIMPKEELVRYKAALCRDVDVVDLEQIADR